MNAADTLRAAVAKKRRAQQAPPKGEDQSAVIAWQANRIVALTIALNQADKGTRAQQIADEANELIAETLLQLNQWKDRAAAAEAELAALRAPTPAGETEVTVTTDWAVYWTNAAGERRGGEPYDVYGEREVAAECAEAIAEDADEGQQVWIAEERITKTTETLQRIDYK